MSYTPRSLGLRCRERRFLLTVRELTVLVGLYVILTRLLVVTLPRGCGGGVIAGNATTALRRDRSAKLSWPNVRFVTDRTIVVRVAGATIRIPNVTEDGCYAVRWKPGQTGMRLNPTLNRGRRTRHPKDRQRRRDGIPGPLSGLPS